MQYVIVVLIAAFAVALVVVPLVRGQRGVAAGDMDAPPLPPPLPRAPKPVMPAVPPAKPPSPEAPGETDAEEMPIVAPTLPPRRPGTELSATEEEVLRFREALCAHTICQFCSAANPPGSKYCKECGKKI